jgi:25S rRNA (uracil2843-N3)-methyltransferase
VYLTEAKAETREHQVGSNIPPSVPDIMSSQKKRQKQVKQNHKPTSGPQKDTVLTASRAHLPLELQQAVLDIFANTLPLAADVDLLSTIQQVKGHLYNRDFSSAFGKEDYLRAYALRWSASRALAYAEIFTSIDPRCLADQRTPESTTSPKVVCLGGGAGAELVALAAAVRHLSLPELHVHAVDIADWSSVLNKLRVSTEQRPPLSAYTSASTKANDQPLLEAGRLAMRFDRQDLLEYGTAVDRIRLQSMLAGVSLVTIMFTLNELFTSSVSKATALLLALTDAMEPGSWLLVVDSPGSYSEVTLGTGIPKRYPMQWLLNHTMLEAVGTTEGVRKWRKHCTDDSKWFRIDPRLKYLVELENMRYQMHLFHREDKENRIEDG